MYKLIILLILVSQLAFAGKHGSSSGSGSESGSASDSSDPDRHSSRQIRGQYPLEQLRVTRHSGRSAPQPSSAPSSSSNSRLTSSRTELTSPQLSSSPSLSVAHILQGDGGRRLEQASRNFQEARRVRQDAKEKKEQYEKEKESKDPFREVRKTAPPKKIDLEKTTKRTAKELGYESGDSDDSFYKEVRETLINLDSVKPHYQNQKTAKEFGLVAAGLADSTHAKHDSEQEDVAEFYLKLAKEFLDLALGLDPVTGVARSSYEFLIGRNVVTGAKLTNPERTYAFLGIITAGGFSSVNKGLKAINVFYKRTSSLRHVAAESTIIKALMKDGRSFVRANEELFSGWIKSHVVVKVFDGKTANIAFTKKGLFAPFMEGKPVFKILTRKPGKWVRVYNEAEGGKAAGSWLMKRDAILKLSPEDIARKYNLPNIPTHVVDVLVPGGTSLFRGRAAFVDFGRAGKKVEGAVQYLLKEKIPTDSFKNIRRLRDL